MKAATQKILPPSLSSLIASIERRLPALITESIYQDENRQRSLRSDRKANLLKVLIFLIRHCDVSSGCLVRRVAPTEYATITPSYVAEALNLSKKTIDRIFSYLTSLGILLSDKQKILKVPARAGVFLVFTSVRRKLSDKLWLITGLLAQLRADRGYRMISQTFTCIKRQVRKKFVPHCADSSPQLLPQRNQAQRQDIETSSFMSVADILQASLFLRKE